MIPEFNHSFVLPPFVGERLSRAQGSPYNTTTLELTQRFATSPARATLLRGWLAYRDALRELGFVAGFQWLDGSFVENIEAAQNRPPKDIDLVTFAHAPDGMSHTDINQMMTDNPTLFDRDTCLNHFHCDVFLVNLGKAPEKLVQDVRYWYGQFSHRRGDGVWKGLVQVPLQSDDNAAHAILSTMQAEE